MWNIFLRDGNGNKDDNREGMTREDAGRMGGEAVVEKYGPDHMAEIGRRGGEKVSKNREHMAAIGRKGGQNSGKRNRNR